jgi:pilus assembly protein CpaE
MLNLQSQSTMVDLVENVDDLDTEFFENIVATHDSGLKVLLGPSRPELYEAVEAKPTALADIVKKVSGHYDFIVIDTSTRLDEVLLNILDMANLILLVCIPTIPSVKNARLAMDLFDKLKYPNDKIMLAVNRVPDDRQAKRSAVSLEKITDFLKHKVTTAIPSNETVVNRAINKAVPVIATDRDKSKSPIKELLELADSVFNKLEHEKPAVDVDENDEETRMRRPGLGFRLGR